MSEPTITNGYSQESGEGFDPIEAEKFVKLDAAEADEMFRARQATGE
ncbi:hypothetical protein [Plantibacter sp. 2H11-2]